MIGSVGVDSCCICDVKKEEGIRIISAFICESCEQQIVSADPQQEQYDDYVHRLKNVHRLSLDGVSF